jgi:hypothetical protein
MHVHAHIRSFFDYAYTPMDLLACTSAELLIRSSWRTVTCAYTLLLAHSTQESPACIHGHVHEHVHMCLCMCMCMSMCEHMQTYMIVVTPFPAQHKLPPTKKQRSTHTHTSYTHKTKTTATGRGGRRRAATLRRSCELGRRQDPLRASRGAGGVHGRQARAQRLVAGPHVACARQDNGRVPARYLDHGRCQDPR